MEHLKAAGWLRERTVSLAFAGIVMAGMNAAPAWGQCSTTSVASASWVVGTTWNNGVPVGSSNTCIDNSSAITLNGSGVTNTLNLVDTTDSLNIGSSGTLGVSGAITNGGAITLSGSLELTGNVSLSGANSASGGGPGTLTMQTGSTISTNSNNGWTLTNQSGSTIQGAGTIGAAGPPGSGAQVNFSNAGTVNANAGSGTELTLANAGTTVSNTGLLEATGNGTLNLQDNINNVGGNITASGGTVSLNGITVTGGTLNILNSGTMQTAGSATLSGTSAGGLTLSDSSTYTAGANTTTGVGGNIILGTSTGSNIQLGGNLLLTGSTILSGPGSLTMAAGSVISTNANNNWTLTNSAGTTIQGAGTIGGSISGVNSGNQVIVQNNGTINANSSGNTLTISTAPSALTNANLLEATNGGTLLLQNNLNNVGGKVTADGGTVSLDNMTISGGTLNTLNGGTMQTTAGAVAGLDGTPAGGVALSNGSVYTAAAGTRLNTQGNIILGTSGSGSTIQLGGNLLLTGSTTLSGPGSLTMTAGSVISTGADNTYTLTNSAGTTIQGAGMIGASISGVNSGPYVIVQNNGVIDANSSGNTLQISTQSASFTNANLLEATNGGTLLLQSNLNNVGGNVTADGGTVNLDKMTVSGGTLNTLNGGTMQTASGSVAGLDGTPTGGLTLSNGSLYTAAAGTRLNTQGNIILGTSGSGSTIQLGGNLLLTGSTTLSGPGSLTMAAGSVISTGADNSYTLTNSAGTTIQGAGTIGASISGVNSGPYIIVQNNGVIDANSSGNTLQISTQTAAFTNTNLLEATNGGTLSLQSNITNTGGNITANGGTVNLDNMTVSGGTLNALNGGTMQTASGSAAGFDGTPAGGLTISDGSTYGAAAGTRLDTAGNINLGTSTGSNIQLGGDLRLTANTTLSGPGTLTMTAGSVISTGSNNGYTLTNNATIQGAGTIGASGLAGSGSQVILTNNGVLAANVSGQTLAQTWTLTNYDGSTGTLTGGTYKATNGATLQLDGVNSSNVPSQIQTNNAIVILSGAGAEITNSTGTSALLGLNNNQGTLVVENGAALATAAGVTNSGDVMIGSNSTMTLAAGLQTLTQTAGETQVDGQLNASLVDIQGGILAGGNGTTAGKISGSVVDDCNISTCGTVQAGDNMNLPVDPPGDLSIGGDYTQNSGASLIVDIGGGVPSLTSQVNVGGNVILNGNDDILTVALLNNYLPSVTGDYLFLTYSGTLNAQDFVLSNANVDPNGTFKVDYSQAGDIYLDFTATNVSPTPEPTFLYAIAGILGVLVVYRRKKQIRARSTAE